MPVAEDAGHLEQLLDFDHVRIVLQPENVDHVQKQIDEDEHEEVVPNQLDDRALPFHHQIEKPLEPLGRVGIPVSRF